MAALYLKQDQSSGQLILESSLRSRLAAVAGNFAWLAVFVVFFFLPRLVDGRFDPESLIILVIIFLFSFVPSIGALLGTSVKIESANRTVTRATRLFFIPIRSTTFSFNDLANIEVQYYSQSSRRSSREAYRVNAIDREGRRVLLNWDGKRDEMFALGQKISAMTGAQLLDHTEKPASSLDQVIEMAKNLGLPLPQSTTTTREMPETPSTAKPTGEQSMTDWNQSESAAPIEEPKAFGPREETSTRADLRNYRIDELEQRVANDPTDSKARYTLARKYHSRGELDRAIETYQAVLQTDTLNAEAQNDLGVAQQQRGKRTEAEAAFRRAIALDPFSFTAHLNLALLLRMMNRATEASQEFFQARQNARGEEEKRLAEAASSGAKIEPRVSRE